MEEKDYLLIERYLSNELNSDEILEFNNRLKNDNNFAKEVSFYKEVENTLSKRFLSKRKEKDLRKTLQKLGKRHIVVNKKKSKIFLFQKYSKYLVAASLVVFATILWFDRSNPKFTDYNSYPDLELTLRDNNQNKHIKKAEKAFNSKNYFEAQKELETLISNDRTKVELQLYLAICLIEQNHFSKAESILEKIKNGKSVYKNKAIWYLALSKLKQRDYKLCKEYLKKIPKDSDDYKKAQDLLQKL